ncbi:hypothetical protein LEP1GSC127_2958 [Leptospira kirschneri str. 200801925]|uniref:Uncharacterized protein n=1 Tax=Leptospira kirschneri str. 200802841 TaxID=1193047 RepID=A0A828Y3I3_9LEPT|nr:hypothetical protein [Leptospira kirschneri]EKO51372.1 hypothetical protein LEP1GSC131_2030 [Leptospira kirschneri str. 200802841]EMO73965.1 hypothetical protein LEP1GSC127_2958 [Leptospira kirschneri str. 200801925]
MKFNVILGFLCFLFVSTYGLSLINVEPLEFVKVFFPFGGFDLLSFFGLTSLAMIGVSVPDGGLYNETPGLYGTQSRDSDDFKKRGGVASVGRLPFGFGVMLVADGEGISVVGADAVQDTKDFGSGNSGLRITTKSPDIWASFAIVNPGTNNATLGVTITGEGTQSVPYVITVNCATNGSAAITSTATLIKDALEANTNINSAISVSFLGDGTGVVAAASLAALTKIAADLRFDGVTSFSTSAGDLDNLAYNDGELCSYIRKGTVWIPCEEAVNETDLVRIRIVTEGGNLAGQFRKTAIPGKTAIVNGAKFARKSDVGTAELDLSAGVYSLTLDN